MRNRFAALLAVLMLSTCLVLPAKATTKTFDNSTTADAEKMNVIITEVMPQSKNPEDFADTSDLYEYIEIYNRGNSVVNLADYCLLYCNSYGITAATNQWKLNHKFTNVINLVPGNLKQNDPALAKATMPRQINNPNDLTLKPGQFAVIWIWNNDDEQYCADNDINLAATQYKNGKMVTFPKFREAYSSQNSTSARMKNTNGTLSAVGIPDDTLLMVGMGATNINSAAFRLANGGRSMYALAKKEVGQNIASDGFTKSSPITNPDDFLCLFEWGTNGTKGGIPEMARAGYSTIYVPADKVPYMVNRGNELNAKKDETPVSYTDYVASYLDKNFEASYKEMAVMTYWERPTPGYMMPYQWVYVDPDCMPENAKNYIYDKILDDEALIMTPTKNGNWDKDMYAFLEETKLIVDDNGSGEDETKRDEVDYNEQEELAKREREAAFLTSVDAYYLATTTEERFAAIIAACKNYDKEFESKHPEECAKFHAAINTYNALINTANNHLESATDIAASAFPSSNTTYGQLNSLLKLYKTTAGGRKS